MKQPSEVDELADKLLEHVPTDLKDKFSIDRRYDPARRLTFKAKDGGQICWNLRNQLVDAIKANEISHKGKQLKVRVQDAPDVSVRRGHYWRAVYALKKDLTEDTDFFLVPQSFDIREAKGLELLGRLTDSGYVWDEEIVRKSFLGLSYCNSKRPRCRQGRENSDRF